MDQLKWSLSLLFKVPLQLGVRDSSVESPNTILVIEDLNLLTMKIVCLVNIKLLAI
jgi:hypothetical protein